jgi:hypothetical protein
MTTNAVPSPAEVDVRVNFNRARDDFLEQLSEQEKAQFVNVNTAQELLDGLKNLAVLPKHRQKWTKLLGAVDRCSRQLEPYFGALGMIAQSYPEWTASAWGAFRIILQVSCRHACAPMAGNLAAVRLISVSNVAAKHAENGEMSYAIFNPRKANSKAASKQFCQLFRQTRRGPSTSCLHGTRL